MYFYTRYPKGNDTCEASPEKCHVDEVCAVDSGHLQGQCSECSCADGYSGEGCTSEKQYHN